MTDVCAPARALPAYRPYLARVLRVRALTPRYLRITFTGDDFEVFGTAGLDQRIKLLLPFPDGSMTDFGQTDPEVLADGTWYDRWRALANETRNPLRTYTVRRIDPHARELDVDFVLHEGPGPAGDWARHAQPGDQLVIVGPDQRSDDSRSGIDWHPTTAHRVLLVGDESAAPAIAGIVESLGATYTADAFIEMGSASDELEIAGLHSDRIRLVTRNGSDHGESLVAAVREWADAHTDFLAEQASPRPQELPDVDVDHDLLWESPQDGQGDFYAWVAGESAMVKAVRRLLVSTHGVNRRRVAFMGYWRHGQAERQ